MLIEKLVDPNALLLVLGGTLVATVLRSGFAEIGNTVRALGSLFRKRFSEARARASLATQLHLINREGLLRAPLAAIPDRDLSEGVGLMLQRQSIEAMIDHHNARRIERERIGADGARLCNLAADLAPVFGLAGTLVALTQLPAGGLAPEAISGVVSAAVLTTLYGVLSANLIYGPLGRQITRICEQEEAARQAVIDWLTTQIGATQPIAPRSFVPARPTRARVA